MQGRTKEDIKYTSKSGNGNKALKKDLVAQRRTFLLRLPLPDFLTKTIKLTN